MMTTTTESPSNNRGETGGAFFQIHYFASAAEYTRKQSESLPAPLPLRSLFPLLEDKYPGITQRVLSSCSVSVGLDYVDVPDTTTSASGTGDGGDGGERVIQAGEEVGIIPPVSSG